MINKNITDKDLFEKLASIQHDIWSSWMEYLFSCCINNTDGSKTIPMDKVTHWEREILTKYQDLAEHQKDSDREQVLKYYPLLETHINNAIKSLVSLKEYIS